MRLLCPSLFLNTYGKHLSTSLPPFFSFVLLVNQVWSLAMFTFPHFTILIKNYSGDFSFRVAKKLSNKVDRRTKPGQHDNSWTSCFPDHLPKVINCAFQWSLSAHKPLGSIESGNVRGIDIFQALNIGSSNR